MAVDRDKILQSAQKLVDKKKYDKAIVEYRKLVADDPGDVRTLLKIGDLHLKLDEHEQAIGTYEQVGEYYYREGFSVKAIAVYKQIRGIITRHAQHLEGRYGHIVPRLAEIYTQLGLTSDALAAYDEVATRLRQEGRERDALDIFKKVVELDPQNPIAHLRVADSRARLGDIDKAVDAFGEAARIMLKLSRLDDAIKVLERLLEYRQDPAYARLCGLTYLDRGEPNDGMTALSKLQIAFKANPKDLETLNALARAFDAINQPRKAIEVLKEAARIARDRNDEPEVTRILGQLTTRAPDDPQVKQLATSLQKQQAPADDDQPEIIEEQELEEVFELDEGELEVDEDPGVIDGDAAAQRLLQQVESHNNAGRIDQAIDLMRRGIANAAPFVARPLRHRLSDLLLEAGDQRGSIAEKLVLARELAHEGAADQALQMLDEVLLLHPDHPAALQLRGELETAQQYHYGAQAYGGHDAYYQPMQSYDVESGGVDEVLHRTGNREGMGYDYGQQQYGYQGYPPAEPSQRSLIDEHVLDQADGLTQEGRYEEAHALLMGQLHLAPNHPLVLDRIGELESLMAQYPQDPHAMDPYASGSGPHPIGDPYAQAYGQGYTSPQYEHYDQGQHYDQGYDQGSSGYAADSDPYGTRSGQHHYSPSQAPHLRADVSNQIADGDAQTHYDLGVAYMEMGLYADAIAELNMAARDAQREIVCLSMITNIHLQVGNLDGALDTLHRALNSRSKTREQELQVGYEIANTYEMKGLTEQALHYFEWLTHFDPHYPDPRGTPSQRIHVLRQGMLRAKP